MSAPVLRTTPGLLWGFAFASGRASRIVNETALAAPHDWAWMHFALSDHRARRYLDAFAPAARALILSNEARSIWRRLCPTSRRTSKAGSGPRLLQKKPPLPR